MSFFKTFLAAFLAFIVVNVLLFVFSIMIFAGIATMFDESPTTVKSNSVLVVNFENGVVETATSPMNSIDFSSLKIVSSTTLYSAVTSIYSAANDDKVKGIYINLNGNASIAIAEEIRGAIATFKESGKFVVAYSDSYSQLGYYFSSVADKIYVNPEGSVEWSGISSSVMFYKGLLDKLGIKAEVIRHGSFKAAVEPFIMNSMSPENRMQNQKLVNSIWGTILGEVSRSRSIDSMVLSNYATDLAISSAADAYKYGLVDGLAYEDQVMKIINRIVLWDGEIENDQVKKSVYRNFVDQGDGSEKFQIEIDSILQDKSIDSIVNINLISLNKYSTSVVDKSILSKNKVAIIYADGEIVDGAGEEGQVGSATLTKKLSKARKDDNIKAVVLRVNSPGGSALASEVMWREVELLKAKKPVIISMGSVAASGGYYISAPADMILADKFTLTGSIGVFGLLMNVEDGMRDKLGVNVDVVNTNPYADMGSPFRALSNKERDFLQNSVERVYATFVNRVSDGRNLSFEDVDNIGQGRVWSGVDALEIGLIDNHGGLIDAIYIAAERAGVSSDYKVIQMTDNDDSLLFLLNSLNSVKTQIIKSELGDMYEHVTSVKTMLKNTGVQARMPYKMTIE